MPLRVRIGVTDPSAVPLPRSGPWCSEYNGRRLRKGRISHLGVTNSMVMPSVARSLMTFHHTSFTELGVECGVTSSNSMTWDSMANGRGEGDPLLLAAGHLAG